MNTENIVATMCMCRKAIESRYEGICTVYEQQSVKDEVTKLTKKQPVCVLENQPCRLSFGNVPAAGATDSATTLAQTIKLFLKPDIKILPGSKISVTQTGVTTDYVLSGMPAVYPSHQEITLELFERWA